MLNSFNRIAPVYQLLSRIVYGNQLINAQVAGIEMLPHSGKVAILGGGDGTVLPHLYKLRPQLEILYVEASSEMIRLAKSKVQSEQIINFHHNAICDLRGFDPEYIYAAFFLDMFPNPQMRNVIQLIESQCTKPPSWIVTDFDKSKVEKGNWYGKLIIKLSIIFFKITTSYQSKELPDVFGTLNSLNYKLLKNSHLNSNLISCRELST